MDAFRHGKHEQEKNGFDLSFRPSASSKLKVATKEHERIPKCQPTLYRKTRKHSPKSVHFPERAVYTPRSDRSDPSPVLPARYFGDEILPCRLEKT